jgi:Domain of Unknown Function (DUF1080)
MRYPLPLLLVALVGSTMAADQKNSAYRVTPGAALLEESFAQPALPGAWSVTKGTWQVIDGALDGREKPADKHAGVFAAKLTLPESFILTADLRFEGAAMTSMVFNGAAGHICRVSVNPKGFTVTGEKDKKNDADKGAVLGKVAQDFAPGQWYHFTIEVSGSEMLVYTDAKHVVYGKDERVARAKSTLALTVSKSSVRYDNLALHAAKPDAAWDKHKASLGLH